MNLSIPLDDRLRTIQKISPSTLHPQNLKASVTPIAKDGFRVVLYSFLQPLDPRIIYSKILKASEFHMEEGMLDTYSNQYK